MPETAILGTRAMVTITAAASIMYPHDALPDDVYARVGEKLAVAAGEHPNDVAMREHAYSAGESVYGAVGATASFHVPPYPASHNLGTARGSAPGGRRREQVRPRARRPPTCSCPTAA
jgi:hypothetical protein